MFSDRASNMIALRIAASPTGAMALAISSLCSLHSVGRNGDVLSRGTNRRNADTNQPFAPKLPAHLHEGIDRAN